MRIPIEQSWAVAALAVLAGLSCKPIAAEESIKVRGGFPHLQAAAEAGKVRVAFLGGSITQNANGHSAMLPEWLRERFPGCEVTALNAGLSSTCSTTGAFRLARDVFAAAPVDLLVVEFAVNDDQDAGHSRRDAIRGMEGITRQVRQGSPATDILMVHFVNPEILAKRESGEVPVSVEAHEAVASHYGITSVDVGLALAGGAMDWPTYGGTHPKAEGYRLATGLMAEALEAGLAADATSPGAMPEPLDADSYHGAELVDPQEAAWLGGWQWGKATRDLLPVGSIRRDYEPMDVLRADQAGETLYLSFSGRAIGGFILAGPDAGVVEVSIDAGEWRALDTWHRHSRGLNYPRSVMFASDLEPGGHLLALRIVTRSETGDPAGGTALNLLSFLVNR